MSVRRGDGGRFRGRLSFARGRCRCQTSPPAQQEHCQQQRDDQRHDRDEGERSQHAAMPSVTWRRRLWRGGCRSVIAVSPRRLAGRLRPRVWVAVASMRARGCLWLSSPRTVSAVAERSLSPGTDDPIGALVVRLLEAPHRSGRQRAVSPIDGPRRESRLGQTTLDRSHPLRSVGLEVSSSRSQRSAGKRPPGTRTDDAVDRESASLLEAANRGSRHRAIAAVHGTRRDPLLD